MPAGHHLDDLAAFITASPSSFHAAAEVANRLVANGFIRLAEDEPWPATSGRFVVVRDGAVIAWRAGKQADPGAAGLRIVGAHTDSPGFKLKPRASASAFGWLQAGMEVYGGPLLNSWLDREFGLAGQVVTSDGTVHLVATGPWLRIPQLAPHLDRSVNESLRLDRQQHLLPVFGTDRNPADLMTHLAQLVGVRADDITGHDLIGYTTQPPAVFGPGQDLFASPRLDNLSSVHAGLAALLAAEDSEAVGVLACFDHEEVGSSTRSGASGPFLATTLRRLTTGLGVGDRLDEVLARSLLVSADAGHAVHPNYAQLHDPVHRPMVNAGPLLKLNANQRYASDAIGQAAWRRACRAAGVPTQDFVSNNAVPCGSTIGPLSATRLGVRTVDVGIPLLSMHSARELCGVEDPLWLAQALSAVFAGA